MSREGEVGKGNAVSSKTLNLQMGDLIRTGFSRAQSLVSSLSDEVNNMFSSVQ